MRVTDMATGGGGRALSYAALLQQTALYQAAQDAAAPPSEEEEEEATETPSTTSEEQEKTSSPASSKGLAAAVLNGCVGDFYSSVEGVTDLLTDVELPLPQIVVTGEESCGKSSVLESVAMLPLFPRDSDICTRLPILLKMRHMSHGNVEVAGDPELMPHCGKPNELKTEPQLKMRLIYSDDREQVKSMRNFTPLEASQQMRKWMEEIVKEETQDEKLQGIVDHVLEIEVRSSTVPNLNLIDLPGIVAGKLVNEPDDMMQRTRALVEKYLQMPDTLVLAVVPAFERVRNSQAFQLVQQYNLEDKTIGVLTMVDRALDKSHPEGPLAEVMSRLDGTSRDIVYLKEGYVVVMNRDARSAPEMGLEEFKEEEDKWLQKNLPGYIDRGLASSTVLATKLEKMLADHVRTVWVPRVLTEMQSQREKVDQKIGHLGPDAQDIVDDFLFASPSAARKRMLQLVTPILPELMELVDEAILRFITLVHEDFLASREEHELILAPFQAKKKNILFGRNPGSLVAASMVMMDSHGAYISDNLVRILKNVVLHIVRLLETIIALGQKEINSQRLDRFANLRNFFAGVLWEQLNELLIDEEGLLGRLEKSFLEFDPENSGTLQLPTQTKKIPTEMASVLMNLACNLELYLDSRGFHNTSFGELYLPRDAPPDASLSREMSRLIISAQVPTLPKSCGFGEVPGQGSFNLGSSFFSNPVPGFADAPQDIGEFELRLFFALTSHVVAPLLQSLCDVSGLARKMQEYVSRSPEVSSKTHIFHEKGSDNRKKLSKKMKRLDEAAAELKTKFL